MAFTFKDELKQVFHRMMKLFVMRELGFVHLFLSIEIEVTFKVFTSG